MLSHSQSAEAACFLHDSHRDRWYWSSAVTHAGLSTAPTSRHSARKIHTRPTNFRGVNADTRTSSAPLKDEAMSAGCAGDEERCCVALRCDAEKPGTKIPDNVFGSVFAINVLKNVEQLPSRSCERDCTALVTHLCCTCRVLVPILPVHKPSLNDSFTNRNETVRAVIE